MQKSISKIRRMSYEVFTTDNDRRRINSFDYWNDNNALNVFLLAVWAEYRGFINSAYMGVVWTMIHCDKCGAELKEVYIVNNLVHNPLNIDRAQIVLCQDCFIKLERSINEY